MNWSEMTFNEKVEHIRDGVLRGLSSKLIGNEVGTTRNAIIGFSGRNQSLCRLALVPLVNLHPKAKHPRRKRSEAPPKPKVVAAPKVSIVTLPVPARRAPVPVPEPTNPPVLFRHRKPFECSFIAGDPRSPLVTCCGAPVVDQTSWCAWHLRIVAPESGKVTRRAA